jgi:hypothetical protein
MSWRQSGTIALTALTIALVINFLYLVLRGGILDPTLIAAVLAILIPANLIALKKVTPTLPLDRKLFKVFFGCLALAFIVVMFATRNVNIIDAPPNSKPQSREEALSAYNTVFNNQGWCSLWQKVTEDGLIKKGDCPSNVLEWGHTEPGDTRLLTGVIMKASEDIEVLYPACVTFGEASHTGGTISPWIHNDFIGTNITMHKGSKFSLFFRCDDVFTP